MKTRWSMVETVVLAVVLGVVAGLTLPVAKAAPELKPLSVQEMAYFDATHCLDLTYDVAPFTAQSTSNTAVTITNTLPANTLVSFVMMKLDKAWDAADTESVLIVSGIPTDTDRFLASTQIAADGTEVFFKNTTFEYSTQAYAGTNCMIGILNTNYPAWYISATTNILTTLTPDSLSAFSTFTAGRVRLFFKIYSP